MFTRIAYALTVPFRTLNGAIAPHGRARGKAFLEAALGVAQPFGILREVTDGESAIVPAAMRRSMSDGATPTSPRTSAVCSPSSGAGRRMAAGVAEARTGKLSIRAGPEPGCSASGTGPRGLVFG